MKNRNTNNKENGVKMNGKLLTTKEAAESWGISRWTVYDLVKQGKLRPIVGMKSWRFVGDELEGVLQRL